MTVVLLILAAIAVIAFLARRSGSPSTPSVGRPSHTPRSTTQSTRRPPARQQPFDIRDVEINEGFRAALDVIETKNQSLFVTGRAGTGKSTLLRYFRATTNKSVAVLAPTGLAALNVGGQTIHSFFSFPPRLIDPATLRPSRKADLYRRLDTIIIDEASMVRADLLDGIDAALRLNRGKPNTPFGGVQVVLIGDLFQLPPIVRERDLQQYFAEHYGGPYFFKAKVFDRAKLGMIDLQKIYRQRDPEFIGLLNNIREKDLGNGVLETLNERVCDFDDLDDPESYITLTPTNEAAARINSAFLEKLPGPEFTYEASVSGKFDESAYPTDLTLRLRRGAHVMMLRNDSEKRWVNGTLGIVSAASANGVSVEIDGASYSVDRYAWENVEYYFNRAENKVDQRVIGTFQQYPIRLAWALTIHKSQGQTFERVYLDLGSGAFAHGQTYVALSRCKALQGIALSRPVFASDVIFDHAVYEYKDVFPRLYPRASQPPAPGDAAHVAV